MPDELAQFPDNYAILQTIRLESATQTFMVGNTFDYTDGNDLFFLELHYNEAKAAIDATAQQNGNIAFMDWQVKNQLPQSYGFQYDALNRLKAAKHATGNYVANDAFGVNNISYDKNGNILSLQRHGVPQNPDDCYAIIDDLAYAYTGNQLTGVTELGDTEKGFLGSDGGYTYDANGNLQFDGNRYATFDLYNHLNLPAAYVKYGAGYLEWDYDATGTKLQKRSFDNSSVAPGVALSDFAATPADETRDYLNGIEYVNNQLEAIYHEEGRIIKNNGNFEWQWCLKDHLGNQRVLFSDANGDGSIDVNIELLQTTDYYPFGLEFEGNYVQNVGRENKYKFNGNELQSEFGLNTYDFINRMYDPAIGRFLQLDPLAEHPNQLDKSPFAFSWNNPIRYNDPDGRMAVEAQEALVPDDRWRINTQTGEAQRISGEGSDQTDIIEYWDGNPMEGASKVAEVAVDVEHSTIPGFGPDVKEPGKRISAVLASGAIQQVEAGDDPILMAVTFGASKNLAAGAEGIEVLGFAAGRSGKQGKLRSLLTNNKVAKFIKGWIKQELNSMKRGKRKSIRNPPGKQLAHERGREAAKGFDYKHSNLQDIDLHKRQHKHDNYGRKNKKRN